MARHGRGVPLSTQRIPSSAGSSTLPNQVSTNLHTQPATAVAPTAAVPNQVITPAEEIAQAAFTIEPAITQSMVLPLLSQLATPIAPSAEHQVAPPLLSQLATAVAPTVLSGDSWGFQPTSRQQDLGWHKSRVEDLGWHRSRQRRIT